MSTRIPALAAKRDKNQEYDIESQYGPAKKKNKPDAKIVFWIDWIFLISSVIGVSLDPFLFQSPVIKEDKKCLSFDKRLYITAIIVRSVMDLIYFANMMLAISEAYRKHIQEKNNWPKARMLWRRWKFLIIDILAIPPLPQVLIPFIFSEKCVSKFLDERGLLNTAVMFRYVGLLNTAVLFQYVPRILRIYLTWIKLITSDDSPVMAVGKAAFNFFLYIISSHVFGSFWYLFSVQQELACWHVACNNHVGCIQGSFRCSTRSLGNHTFFNDYCPTTTPNSTVHDFGIYTGAFQSGLVTSINIPGKTVQCFWWGLRSLSSFGQNLETSKDLWECSFASFISLLGLLLFLFFIGNMQTYIQLATEMVEKAKQNMREKAPAIKLWMDKNQIKGDMKQQIMDCVKKKMQKGCAFDENQPLLHLSKELTKKIKPLICLPLLKKVPLFEKAINESDDVQLKSSWESLLKSIYDALRPWYVNENSFIIREGEPLDEMLLINCGIIRTYTTDQKNQTGCLRRGDFYGEELLDWLSESHSSSHSSNLRFSKMTLKCLTKVEGFSLKGSDLKNIGSRHRMRVAKLGLFNDDIPEAEKEQQLTRTTVSFLEEMRFRQLPFLRRRYRPPYEFAHQVA